MLKRFSTSYGFRVFVFAATSFMFFMKLSAQTLPAADSVLNPKLFETSRFYHISRGEHQKIYNGTEFIGYISAAEGIPFFKSPEIQQGDLEYDGIVYHNIRLKYDLIKDDLVLVHPANSRQMVPDKRRIGWFKISEDLFVNTDHYLKNYGLPSGFIQVAEQGKILLLIKRVNISENNLIELQNVRILTNADRFFALKEDRAYPISRKKALLHLMGQKRDEVNQFARKNDLRYRKDKENYLRNTIRLYNKTNP